ncbi:heavy metal-binding domain-containing protein [Priestia aryabhattai]|uniref:heavy metal-binding domain-containing protein n=1 Tax=Priestia megaterium TaxID=1404 RepID=UPI0039B82368
MTPLSEWREVCFTSENVNYGTTRSRFYIVMLEDSRKEALDRMIKNAYQMGTNAIVTRKYDFGGIDKK